MAETTSSTKVVAAAPANIALIGAGWWSQGWHLPALHNNCNANIIAIVDPSPHPQSTLDPNLQPLSVLKDKYQAAIYSSTDEMLNDIGPQLDGVLIATPHATHYEVCRQVMTEIERRNNNNDTEADRRRPLHILMEKPMTTHISHAIDLYNMVQNVPDGGSSKFWINHSANFRSQAAKAREIIASGRLGRIRHVTGFFASPLKWIFEDPGNTGWNEPSEGMLANGFAWGQSSHLFAFLYHILGDDLEPVDVFCSMTHSDVTGADISHSATVRCRDVSQDNNNNNNDFIIMNVTGTTLLPGNAHSDPPVPKIVRVEVYGNDGSLHYGGNDREPDSGHLEVRNIDGSIEVMDPEFLFENLDSEGNGPESLQNFVKLCCGDSDVYTGADVIDGLRSVQTIDAMYRSHASSRLEEIVSP